MTGIPRRDPLWYALDVPPSQVVLVYVQWRTPIVHGVVTYVWRLEYEDVERGPEIVSAILADLWYRWESGELEQRAAVHYGGAEA